MVAYRSQGENSLTWQTLFLAGGELNRWPCQSLTQWLSKMTFDFNWLFLTNWETLIMTWRGHDWQHLQFLHCFCYPIISSINYFHVCVEMLHVLEGCLFTPQLAPRQALLVTVQASSHCSLRISRGKRNVRECLQFLWSLRDPNPYLYLTIYRQLSSIKMQVEQPALGTFEWFLGAPLGPFCPSQVFVSFKYLFNSILVYNIFLLYH